MPKKKNYKYLTQHLWDDLIQIGRDNGLSDNEIADRLMYIEEQWKKKEDKVKNG